MERKYLIGAAAAVVAIGGWALFRPELLFVNKSANEALPTVTNVAGSNATANDAPQLLSMGAFHSVAHETKGTANIYTLPGNKQVLRLTNFETSNGPDVRVYLVAAPDATDNDTVNKAGFIELGKLKGNIGDQNYDIPAGTDLNKYQAVTIWCHRFGVNFATAPLKASADTTASTAPSVLLDGSFHSVAHETKGNASLYDLGGKRVLRLTNFETSNGPDVRVYLVAAPDATDNDTVKNAGFIELGKLKGNIGDQNYDVPANVDTAKYRAVTIWCHRFGVNFATAPLAPRKG